MTGFLGIAFRVVALIPSIIILIGCGIIFSKMRNEGTVLMLVGKALGLLVSLFSTILSLMFPFWIDHHVLSKIAFVLPFISFPASFLFAFGFIFAFLSYHHDLNLPAVVRRSRLPSKLEDTQRFDSEH